MADNTYTNSYIGNQIPSYILDIYEIGKTPNLLSDPHSENIPNINDFTNSNFNPNIKGSASIRGLFGKREGGINSNEYSKSLIAESTEYELTGKRSGGIVVPAGEPFQPSIRGKRQSDANDAMVADSSDKYNLFGKRDKSNFGDDVLSPSDQIGRFGTESAKRGIDGTFIDPDEYGNGIGANGLGINGNGERNNDGTNGKFGDVLGSNIDNDGNGIGNGNRNNDGAFGTSLGTGDGSADGSDNGSGNVFGNGDGSYNDGRDGSGNDSGDGSGNGSGEDGDDSGNGSGEDGDGSGNGSGENGDGSGNGSRRDRNSNKNKDKSLLDKIKDALLDGFKHGTMNANGRYITVPYLKQELSQEEFELLNLTAINFGDNFVNGVSTSPFNMGTGDNYIQKLGESIGKSSAVNFMNQMGLSPGDTLNLMQKSLDRPLADKQIDKQQAMEAGAAAGMAVQSTIDAVNTLSNLSKIDFKEKLTLSKVKDLGIGLVEATAKKIAEESGNIAAVTTQRLALSITSIPNKILSASMAYFSSYKKSLGEITKEIMTSPEEMLKNDIDKSDVEAQKNFTNKITEKIDFVNSKIIEYSNMVTPYAQMVTAYLHMGPEWVADKLDGVVAATIKKITDFTDSSINTVEQNVNDWCNGQGEKAGKFLVDKYNDGLKAAAIATLKIANTTIAKALAVAAALIQEGLLLLMGLLGISLPVPSLNSLM